MSLVPLRQAFGRCAVRAAVPTLLAVVAAVAGALAHRDEARLGGGGAWTPWLHLAPFVAAAACTLAAIEFWPLFAARRPGADFVQRCTPRPLHGCPTAAAGALLALAALLLPMAALAALALPTPHAHRPLAAVGRALLDSGDTRVEFAAPGAGIAELRVRPVALLPKADPVPTEVRVLGDGEPLTPEPIAIASARQLLRIPVAGRSFARIVVERAGGNLPLLFPEGSVVAVASEPDSVVLQSLMAFALYLVPTAVALAVAMLAAPVVALPVNLLVAAAVLALQVLGELGPAANGMALATRGQWLATEPVFRACLPSLGTGIAGMIGAMLLRQGARRWPG